MAVMMVFVVFKLKRNENVQSLLILLNMVEPSPSELVMKFSV